ncbi:MAG: hypothetical protein V3U19_04915 [Thermodesulfobacteriota bacterium]
MKRRLVLIVIFAVLLLSSQSLASFQESRWQIMDLLAYPDKIEPGFKSYSVSQASWEKNDLADRIPRWLAQPAKLYNYELVGSPIKSATMTGIITDDSKQVNQLKIRAILLMRAVGMSKGQAEENFKVLMDSAKKDKDQEYYIDAERIRTRMTVFSSISMLMLTMSKV